MAKRQERLSAQESANSDLIPPRKYPDLHEHLERLEREGLLIRIKEPVDKDQDMHPLVRWQFRGGIKEKDRKAFLFENPVDAKGRQYDIPVAIGVLAANRKIYGIGLGSDPSKVNQLWAEAKENPIPPVEIPSKAAPVHEVIFKGNDLRTRGQGLDGIPVPISTPGWDNAPYVSAAHFISKDPESGIQNIGTYRAMIKAPDRVGCNPSIELGQGIYAHWEKYRARGEKMPAALCIGGVPAISYVAAQKLAYDVDELAVAGGLVKAPIRVVKAKTVPLLVPADGEIIIEGFISTEWLEPEAPFGESHGHVNRGILENGREIRRRAAFDSGGSAQHILLLATEQEVNSNSNTPYFLDGFNVLNALIY